MALRVSRDATKGFIALFALISLAVLVGVVAMVLVFGSGRAQRLRQRGGEALAMRAAQEVLSRQLVAERLRQPRQWIPATAGEATLPDGTLVKWWRRSLESRWRAGARPWGQIEIARWIQLGARPETVAKWAQWFEARSLGRDPTLGLKGDLITDRAFLRSCFVELGLEAKGFSVDQVWTTDEAGSLNRLNLIGADPHVLAQLSGVPQDRIEAVQRSLEQGVDDPSRAAGLWSYAEGQALEPWVSLRPLDEVRWTTEVRLPNLRDPILLGWRSSFEEGPPGNPWFQLRPLPLEQW